VLLVVALVALACAWPPAPAGPAHAADPARRPSVVRAALGGVDDSVPFAMPVLRPHDAFFREGDDRPLDAVLVPTDLWYVVTAYPAMIAVRIQPDGEPAVVGSWVGARELLAASHAAGEAETRLVDVRGRTVLLATRDGRTMVLPVLAGQTRVEPIGVRAYTAQLRTEIPLDPVGLAAIPGIVWTIIVLVGLFPALALLARLLGRERVRSRVRR
jgi:hypothetical protein